MANTMARNIVTTVENTLLTAVTATPTAPPTPVITRLTALVMALFQSKSAPGRVRFHSRSSAPSWIFSSSQA